QAPVLVVAGDRDVVRPEHTVEMYHLLPNARLAIVPGEHGEYIGEITTLKKNGADSLYIVTLIEEFLNQTLQ
ncbi:MAG TPA: alpha/beta hydrolase, partial [Chitinophagaceae bacterium]|nr:alpha/beta hydrolase [Chitinophagaceae bacterium]